MDEWRMRIGDGYLYRGGGEFEWKGREIERESIH